MPYILSLFLCAAACVCVWLTVSVRDGHPHTRSLPHPHDDGAQGEVTEGSDSEIRAAFFVVAVTREYNEALGRLEWRIVELSMQGSMLYL